MQHAGKRTHHHWVESSRPAQRNSSQHCKLAYKRSTPVQAPAKRARAAPPSTVTLVVLPEQAIMALFRPVLVVAALVALFPRPTILKLQTALQGQPLGVWWQAFCFPSSPLGYLAVCTSSRRACGCACTARMCQWHRQCTQAHATHGGARWSSALCSWLPLFLTCQQG